MNRVVFFAGPSKKLPTSHTYTWTAFNLPAQEGYQHKAVSPFWVDSQVADEAYDPAKDGQQQSPVLRFGALPPDREDMGSEEFARLDMSVAVHDKNVGARVQDDPIIAAPIKDSEELVISLDTKFMILLPEKEEDMESRHMVMGWRPSVFSNQRVEVRIVRDDFGDTYLELFLVDGKFVEKVVTGAFEQWDLNRDKNHFTLTIRSNRVSLLVNGNAVISEPYTSSDAGEGSVTLFAPVHSVLSGEQFQAMNIAELYRLKIERKPIAK